MVYGLQEMLDVLSTKKAQLRFLESIPNPDQEVIELLINKFENENTILNEAETLKQSGDIKGYEELAKKSIDLSMQTKQIKTFFSRRVSLTDVLTKFRDPTLTQYAVEKIDDLPNSDENPSIRDKGNLLWETIRFAENSAETSLRIKQLDKLLVYEMQNNESFARILEELGRYDDAIEQYMIEGGIYLEEEGKALELAKLHSPHRVKEIAGKIVENFDFSDHAHKIDFYLQCVDISGKDEQATKQLKKYSRNLKDSSDAYHLIPALMRFGLFKEAKKCVKYIERNPYSVFSGLNDELNFADLYYEVGETKKARNIFEKMFNDITKGSNILDNDKKLTVLEKLAEIKRDTSVLDKGIEICLEYSDYKGCVRLAEAQGKYELASTYRSIERLLEE